MNGFASMIELPTSSEQLEFTLWPHDGTPLSFLKSLRRQLDGFNPDRAQLEKQYARPVIETALRKLRSHAAEQYGAARSLFPGIGPGFDGSGFDVAAMVSANENEQEEGLCPACLAGQEPELVLVMPTMAPDARRARGTPVSAPSLSVSPLELVSCNRGLSPFPTSMSPRAVSVAFGLGIQSNQALA